MPNATDHKSSSITKRLLVGDSGVGKTTALAGLAQAGYQLHIYDFDNLLDPLIARLRREDAKALARIEFMSFRDKMKATPQGPTIDGQPTAFVDALRALDKWEDGSRAAYFWARGLQGAAGIAEGVAVRGIEPRNIFFTAQQAVMNCIALLTSVNFSTNILVIAHIKYMEQGGITKGFPLSVGTAISPEIPTYFPSVTLATKSGEKRILRTKSTSMIDLKDPRSFEYGDELPIEDLAKLFPKSA
jgi:hypothetical protein